MKRSYPILNAAISSQLDQKWTSPRQLAERLELWSVNSVRHELSIMFSEGAIERTTKRLTAVVEANFYRTKNSNA